jgi:cytochrome c556
MRQAASLFIAASAMAALCSCAPAGPARSSGSVAMSPEQVVAGRQAAFRLSASTFQLVRTAAEKGADLKLLGAQARNLSQWAHALPGMFPEGTGPGVANTRARAEIWTNRADFEQKAADYAAAAARLAELAQAGDMAEGGRQWDATRATCTACHQKYRNGPAPGSPF